MTKAVHGTIHGNTIELDEDLGIPDGEEVDVILTPSNRHLPCAEGIKRSAGAAASIPEFDAVFEEIERDRRAAMYHV